MVEEGRSHDVEYVALDTWHVVFDTNEVFGDFRPQHRELQFLFENAQQPRFRLCMPEVVVREMANHFLERWSEARDRYEAAQLDLERLIGRTMSDKVQADEIRVAADRYEIELRHQLVGLGVHIEPIPAALAAVETLLRRDLGRRKPFGNRKITDRERNRRDRGGMRDALIWESVLAMCDRERRSLAIITDNVGDFGNSQGDQLHEDLLDDLAKIGLGPQNVKLYKTIKAFNDEHIRSRVPDQAASADLHDGVAPDADSVSEPSMGSDVS